MNKKGRYRCTDWRDMVRILKEAGHWKRLPGGKPFSKSKHPNKIQLDDKDRVYNKQEGGHDERLKEYFDNQF